MDHNTAWAVVRERVRLANQLLTSARADCPGITVELRDAFVKAGDSVSAVTFRLDLEDHKR